MPRVGLLYFPSVLFLRAPLFGFQPVMYRLKMSNVSAENELCQSAENDIQLQLRTNSKKIA